MPRHLFGQVLAECRGVGEVEVELQQIPQPHRLTPERFQPISVGTHSVGESQVDDRRLEERIDERIAVERRLMLVFGSDPPDGSRPPSTHVTGWRLDNASSAARTPSGVRSRSALLVIGVCLRSR